MKNKLNILPDNPQESADKPLGRFPKHLHRKMPKGGTLPKTSQILQKWGMNTVCEEAKCPNRFECYSKNTATFLALGKDCTRACSFCDIDFAKAPKPLDPNEPSNIANAAKELGLKHVVITMVARDDLEDQGSSQIASIIREIRKEITGSTTEVLTSDFNGNFSFADHILDEKPEVFNHNLETVRRLTPRIRHKATYERTLQLLSYVKEKKCSRFIKSGIMVGLGESKEEVFETLHDLKNIGCDIVTIGHYLQPNRHKVTVKEFISEETFKEYEEYGTKIGIKHMYSGPFVRSSYNADLFLQ